MTPKQYAFILCKEMGIGEEYILPTESVISEQIEHYKRVIENYPTHIHERKKNGSKNKEEKSSFPSNLRVIKLDVSVDNFRLRDQFEWDINNSENNPDSFARSLCGDLGLQREFEVAVAHAIREQVLLYRYEALEKGQFGQSREYEWDGHVERFDDDEDKWGPQLGFVHSYSLTKRDMRQIKRTGPETSPIVSKLPFNTFVSLEEGERKGKRRTSSNMPNSSSKKAKRSATSTPRENITTPSSPSILQPFVDDQK